MARLFALFVCSALALGSGGPAAAGQLAEPAPERAVRPVVLELFVSQNCAACLEANATMAELSASGDVLPLTYDVDYWDYLGWRDTLAHPDFSERQRDYARRLGQARVYTPQIVIDGREARPGGDGPRIKARIRQRQTITAPAPPLTARREGGEIAIEIGDGAVPPEGAEIWLVIYRPGHVTTDIGAGENQGRSFTVVNPVREVALAGHWNGVAETLRAPAPMADAYAVLVQQRNTGAILAAAKGF